MKINTLKHTKDSKIKHKLIYWFFIRPKKWKIYNNWLSAGTTIAFAIEKAKNNVPYFKTTKEYNIWLRTQKLKKILN